MPAPMVLVVDDEATVRDVVGRYLEREGFGVSTAATGPDALRVIDERPPDLVVLDLMLPGLSGEEVCRRVRSNSNLPIIMLTARGRESERVLGLGLGADDYVVKPFSPNELTARVKAVLRRSERLAAYGAPIVIGPLKIDTERRSVSDHGAAVQLTPKEFDLLHFLALHPGQVFSRETLLERVWGWGFEGDASTVTVHVRRLRLKIEEDPDHPAIIKTVWAVGYKLEATSGARA